MVFAFMTTVNILSVGSYDLFLTDVLKLRAKYIKHKDDGNLLPCMSNFLRYPNFLAICNLDDDTKAEVERKIINVAESFQVGNTKDTGFLWLEEINQLERLLAFMTDDTIGELEMNRSDFWKYVNEYDRRRNTDFASTFPELAEYYSICKTCLL